MRQDRVARGQRHRVILRREVVHQVRLTTQGQLAPLALQTNVRLTAEQTAVVARTAADVEAAFQVEDALQAAAQVFNAAQAPQRTRHTVARLHGHARDAAAVGTGDLIGPLDASIGHAVQGHARLRGGACGNQGCSSSRKQLDLHIVVLEKHYRGDLRFSDYVFH